MKGTGPIDFFKAGAINLFFNDSFVTGIFSRNATVDFGILFVTGTTFFRARDFL